MFVGNQHNPARCPEHVSVFFPKVKQLVMNTTQESAPRQCVGRWCVGGYGQVPVTAVSSDGFELHPWTRVKS